MAKNNPASFDRTRRHLGKVWGYPKQLKPVEMRTFLGGGSFTDAYLGKNGRVYTETTPGDPSKHLMAEFRETLPPDLRKHCPDIEYLGKKGMSPGSDNDVFRMPLYNRSYQTLKGEAQESAFSVIQDAWEVMKRRNRADTLDYAEKKATYRGMDKDPYVKKFLKIFRALDAFLTSRGMDGDGVCWDVPDRNLGWKGDDLIFMDVFFDDAHGSTLDRGAHSGAVMGVEPGHKRDAAKALFERAVEALDAAVGNVLNTYGPAVWGKTTKISARGFYGYSFGAPSGATLTIKVAKATGRVFAGEQRGGVTPVAIERIWETVEEFFEANGGPEAAVEVTIDNKVAAVYAALGLSDQESSSFAKNSTERGPLFWRAVAPDGAEAGFYADRDAFVWGRIGSTKNVDAAPSEVAAFLYQHGVRSKQKKDAPAAANAIMALVNAELHRIISGAGASMVGPSPPSHGMIHSSWLKPGQSPRQVVVQHLHDQGALQWLQIEVLGNVTKSRLYQDTVQGAYALVADVFKAAQAFGLQIAPGRGVRVPTKSK